MFIQCGSHRRHIRSRAEAGPMRLQYGIRVSFRWLDPRSITQPQALLPEPKNEGERWLRHSKLLIFDISITGIALLGLRMQVEILIF